MKTIKSLTKVILASALLLPFYAQAAPGDCSEWLHIGDGYLAAAISGGLYTGKRAATDESNLLTKLAAAEAKVSFDKFSDAIDKLDQISEKATDLANAQKSKLDDATAINNAVTDAIGCVAALVEPVE